MRKDMKPLTLYVTESLAEEFKQLAKEQDRTVSWCLNQAAQYYLRDCRPVLAEVRAAGAGGHTHLEDAIADAEKRGPVRKSKAKHK